MLYKHYDLRHNCLILPTTYSSFMSQRLQNSDEQEIAKNYFKNSRAEEILS